MSKKRPWPNLFSYKNGVLFWGGAAIAAGGAGISSILLDVPKLNDMSDVLSAIIVTTGVAWSWFLQMEQNERHYKKQHAQRCRGCGFNRKAVRMMRRK